MADPRRVAFIGRLGLVVLAVAAIGLALWSMGGIHSGRVETRDNARMQDLHQLANFVRCVANAEDGVLPQTLAPDSRCMSTPPLADRFDDTPYRYEVTSARGFSLCARFERAETLNTYSNASRMFDRDTGCLNVMIDADQGD